MRTIDKRLCQGKRRKDWTAFILQQRERRNVLIDVDICYLVENLLVWHWHSLQNTSSAKIHGLDCEMNSCLNVKKKKKEKKQNTSWLFQF